MTATATLIADIEAAAEPTWELNLRALAGFGWVRDDDPDSQYWTSPCGTIRRQEGALPRVVYNAGDALAMVPEGWRVVHLLQTTEGLWDCQLCSPFSGYPGNVGVKDVAPATFCRTSALAVCAAVARAVEATHAS